MGEEFGQLLAALVELGGLLPVGGDAADGVFFVEPVFDGGQEPVGAGVEVGELGVDGGDFGLVGVVASGTLDDVGEIAGALAPATTAWRELGSPLTWWTGDPREGGRPARSAAAVDVGPMVDTHDPHHPPGLG